MEAAGVIRAIQILAYAKPVYVVKALTNRESEYSSDEEQANDYETNVEVAMKTLVVFIRELVHVLSASCGQEFDIED